MAAGPRRCRDRRASRRSSPTCCARLGSASPPTPRTCRRRTSPTSSTATRRCACRGRRRAHRRRTDGWLISTHRRHDPPRRPRHPDIEPRRDGDYRCPAGVRGGLRAADGQPTPLEEGLVEAGMTTIHVVEISAQPIDREGTQARRDRAGAGHRTRPRSRSTSRPPRRDWAGGRHDRRPGRHDLVVRRGPAPRPRRSARAPTRTFVITRPKPAPAAARRGRRPRDLRRQVGKQLLKVVTFPIGTRRRAGRSTTSSRTGRSSTRATASATTSAGNYTADAPYFDGEASQVAGPLAGSDRC